MAGQYYNCHDKIFLEFKKTSRKLLAEYNALAYDQKQKKTEILKQLLGSMGTNVSVGLLSSVITAEISILETMSL